ncbi:MAG: MFS transporter, partial [Gammaproteobacteria bacterium]|nr:MFS transporter [Gammaproteobacteria bacterium]
MNRKHITVWALYDFANSVYPAVITTAVFSVYYAQTIVGNGEGLGDLYWTSVIWVSVLFVAFTSPLLGSIADLAGVRKKMMFLYTVLCVVSVALFTTLEPGMILWGFFLAVLANIGFEGALVYYNAYLPDIAPPEKQGFVSGLGYGVGYAGSIIGLLIALPLVTRGLYDLTWLSVAVFFAIGSIPAFLYLPKDSPGERTVTQAAIEGIKGFRKLVAEVVQLQELRRFLTAFFFYINGVLTVIVCASLFAAGELGFTPQELIYLFLVTQVSALLGAFALARPTDIWGPKRVISLTLILWTSIVISTYFIYTKPMFFMVTVLAGIGLGAVQAASRSLMASLIPEGKEAEMFGFYAFCGKSSAVLGPFMFGVISYGWNRRLAVLAIGLFFLLGFILLQRVKDTKSPG